MNDLEYLKLKVELPFLMNGGIYAFHMETGEVYRCDRDCRIFGHALRDSLSGYLWLLKTEREKYFNKT